MRQLHVVMDLNVASGGLGLAAVQLASAISASGRTVTLLAMKDDGDIALDLWKYSTPNLRIVQVNFKPNPISNLYSQIKEISALLSAGEYDLVHLHGVWQPFLFLAGYLCHSRKIPYVISSHGCLSPWALNHKAPKKAMALRTYQGYINKRAAMFFATAEQEVEALRQINVENPIALVPNGVDCPEDLKRARKAGPKKILFLSRIHPVKGLLNLVTAWAAVRNPDWRIVIAGPDEDGYRSEIEAEIEKLNLSADVEFLGLVHGVEKDACFLAADLFVLPTYSENFGIVIAEALAHSVPVITTKGAPWQELQSENCGWWIDVGVPALIDALREALGTDEAVLRQMGIRGRELILSKYSMASVAQKAIQGYEWIFDKSSKPECVRLM